MTTAPPAALAVPEPYRFMRPGPHRSRTRIEPTDRVAVRDQAATAHGLGTAARAVLDFCRTGALVGDLAAATGLRPGVVLVVLTDLEHAGLATITANTPPSDDHSGGMR